MKKGILQLILAKEEVIFYSTDKDKKIFSNLNEFLDYSFGSRGVAIFATLQEINAIHDYLKEYNDKFETKILYVSSFIKKIIGLKITRKDNKGRGITLYDIKYKLGSDELEIPYALNLIEKTEFKSYNEGYTGKLRKEIITDDSLRRGTIDNPPSMAPIIYTKTCKEFSNVQCWDITSAYPFLLTQPLPHYDKTIEFTNEDIFNDQNFTYYGSIQIFQLEAKKPYYPLTLIGKNNKEIVVEKQGENIKHAGVRIISADKVVINGFIPHILELLKQNYSYKSYQISSNLMRFQLKVDQKLKEKVIEYFERKQEKKRNNLNYSGEKILLNRLYGFLITRGSNAAAHYGQYIVSKERLILNSLIHKIGLKDVIHCHTDSIKFIGNHAEIIEDYNSTIPFSELGRFMLEDVYQKCVYFSHITAKYIDKEGKLGLKHGGIDKVGIAHLYKKSYEEITKKTKFFLIRSYFYLEGEGYYPNYTITDFSHSVEEDEK